MDDFVDIMFCFDIYGGKNVLSHAGWHFLLVTDYAFISLFYPSKYTKRNKIQHNTTLYNHPCHYSPFFSITLIIFFFSRACTRNSLVFPIILLLSTFPLSSSPSSASRLYHSSTHTIAVMDSISLLLFSSYMPYSTRKCLKVSPLSNTPTIAVMDSINLRISSSFMPYSIRKCSMVSHCPLHKLHFFYLARLCSYLAFTSTFPVLAFTNSLITSPIPAVLLDFPFSYTTSELTCLPFLLAIYFYHFLLSSPSWLPSLMIYACLPDFLFVSISLVFFSMKSLNESSSFIAYFT